MPKRSSKPKDIKALDAKPEAKPESKPPYELKDSIMEAAVRKEAPENPNIDPALAQLPKEAQEKLKALKETVERFKTKVIEKFDTYIMGITLLPPPRPAPGQPPLTDAEKAKIGIMVLIDDSDSKKMSKQELGTKLQGIMAGMAKEIDPNLAPDVLLLSELWQNLYDQKYELLQTIAMSAPFYDKGMLAAIKIAEIHKTMVLKKFERYIVSYVLAGSLVQGKATEKSDIDVFIVIDDTDVKRMTRLELKDKLRAIIIGMGIEAGDLTGIRNKINIQVYILTEFWDSIREANPIIFTFLRDGVPLYDRGIFMPWKQLLRLGKIKPSPEAIELYMGTGEQVLKRVKYKLKEIGLEDTFWAILTPSQAALMMYGIPPPTPKETPQIMREIFVKRDAILEEEYVKILERNITLRKDLEHGDKKEITGREVDELLADSERYLKRIEKLFSEIEERKQKEGVTHAFDSLESAVRDVLRLVGVERVPDANLLKVFDEELIKTGKLPLSLLKELKALMAQRANVDKTPKAEIEKIKKESEAALRQLVEHIQRTRGLELSRAKIRVKYGEKHGEVIFLGDEAYIVKDIDAEQKHIQKGKLAEDGTLKNISASSFEELEKVLASNAIPPKVYLREKLFENLKLIFGPDVEILVNY